MTKANPETSEALDNSSSTTWAPSIPMAVIGALVGGLIGLGIIEALHPSVPAKDRKGFEKCTTAIFPLKEMPSLNEDGGLVRNEEAVKFYQPYRKHYAMNYAVEFAIFSACIALVLVGLTVTYMRIPSAILAALLAAIGSAAGGYWAGLRTGYVVEWTKTQVLQDDLISTLAIWLPMCVGIGLGATLLQKNSQNLVKALVASLLAGIFASVVIILIFSTVFSDAEIAHHVPVVLIERIVWIVATTAVLGLTFAMGMQDKNKPKAEESAGETEMALANEMEAEANNA